MPSATSSTDSELVIRTLYEIAGGYDLGLEHEVKRILELGLTRFNLEIGILSNICDTTSRVVHQVSLWSLGRRTEEQDAVPLPRDDEEPTQPDRKPDA
jgi:hypothetical protein